jgi:hypothetical protein
MLTILAFLLSFLLSVNENENENENEIGTLVSVSLSRGQLGSFFILILMTILKVDRMLLLEAGLRVVRVSTYGLKKKKFSSFFLAM